MSTLAGRVRRSVGVDAPQQLINDTAPPAALPVVAATPGPAAATVAAWPTTSNT